MSEDNASKSLPVTQDQTPLSESNIPISKQWLKATDPTFITPVAFTKGGMTRIAFCNPTGESVVNVYRSIGKYIGGGIGLQDEIHPYFENTGAQLNFEWDPSGKLIQFNPSVEPNDTLQRCISLIQGLVTQKGATIISSHKDYGLEMELISNGQVWLDKNSGQEMNSSTLLPSGALELNQPST
jgi:hypothetical protein